VIVKPTRDMEVSSGLFLCLQQHDPKVAQRILYGLGENIAAAVAAGIVAATYF